MNTRLLAGWELAGKAWCVAVLLLLLACASTGAAGVNQELSTRSEGVLVSFRNHAPLSARLAVLQRFGLRPDARFNSTFAARLMPSRHAELPSAHRPERLRDLIAQLRRDPAVRVAEPDYPVRVAALPNDPDFTRLWGLQNDGQTGGLAGADIKAPAAWDVTMGRADVIVAVIDTGVDYDHPDLRSNVLRNASGNVLGYDFANGDPDPMDDNGHGTHVAGTLGAIAGNGLGIAGVCPRVRIMPLKFLDASGNGSTSDAIAAIDFAVAHGAHVLNNSWGGGSYSQLLKEAIDRARDQGVLFIAAAGNDAANNDETPTYPANYNAVCNNVISVAATDDHDRPGSFSNFGARGVDLAAPGVRIYSTLPGNRYGYRSGTSMAAPHVAGAAALVRGRYPSIPLAAWKARLLGTSDRVASLERSVRRGRLNLRNALTPDNVAPGAPRGFQVTHRAGNALLLAWIASGEDGSTGAATEYELRYSTQPITPANYYGAVRADGLPEPGVTGYPHQYLLTGLTADREYFLALRAMDRVGNLSAPVLLGPVRTGATVPELHLVQDNVEGAPQFHGDWSVTTEQAASPSHAYTDSPGRKYSASSEQQLRQLAPVTLAGMVPVLRFRAEADLEPGYDFLYVDVSTDDGASWERQPHLLTGSFGWSEHVVPLARYYGERLRVRFRLVSDHVVHADGVWIDDIRVCGQPLVALGSAVAVPPPPPTGLIAAAGSAQVSLAWTGSPAATGYSIQRATTSTGPFVPIGTTTDRTVFTDTGLKNGTAYFYVVRAVNAAGKSAASNVASAIPRLPSPPRPPHGLSARPGKGYVTLRWSQTGNVAQHRIYRSESRSGNYQLLTTVAAGRSQIDASVVARKRYFYQVTAVSAEGAESARSKSVSAAAKPLSNR